MAMYSVVADDGSTYGPVDDAGLTQWAQEGRVTASTTIRCEPGGQTLPAASLPLLASVFGPTTPPAAPAVPPMPAYAPSTVPTASSLLQAEPHRLSEFPAAVAVLLHFLTFGLGTWILMGLMHGRLPKNRFDDPGTAKAILYLFIPFYNIYWMFFLTSRLCDRIDEQRRQQGLPIDAPRGLGTMGCIMVLIPYVSIIGFLMIWPAFIGILQSKVNELVGAGERAAQPFAPVGQQGMAPGHFNQPLAQGGRQYSQPFSAPGRPAGQSYATTAGPESFGQDI